MEAWKPMQNVMEKMEPAKYRKLENGSVVTARRLTDSADGYNAAKIADQAIMQMLCDND
jgi:hypothetical protein